MKKLLKFFEKRQVLAIIILSFFLNILIEILARKSVVLGLKHIIYNAPVFFYNVLLIVSTLSISFFFKRRYSVALIVAIIWFALGISNFVIIIFRTIPLSAIDFTIMKSGIKIMPMYFSKLQIILLIIAAFAVVSLIIYAVIKLPKKERKFSKVTPAITIVLLSFALITVLLIQNNILSNDFKNLIDANKQYGFAYCFSRTIFDRGVSKPKDYSKEAIDGIISEIETDGGNNSKDINDDAREKNRYRQESDTEIIDIDEIQNGKPNIIFLQLESFFDVNYMKAITYSEDPVPVFRYLKNKYSSGFMSVTSIGAGTANTEFEVITGMSLEFFGAGEYPYTTILKESTCETINYNLKELMYKTHALHNHTATFYERDKVYSQLGFDSFTPIEYMDEVEFNEIGWAKDKVLIQEIVKALKSSKGKDFLYTISVQGHGKYPSESINPEQKISLSVDDISSLNSQSEQDDTNNSENDATNDKLNPNGEDIITNEDIIDYAERIKVPFEYYINQLNEMDKFIGGLISILRTIDEPIVLVIFGDHLPAFEIKNEYLKNNDIFQTEYIVWDNIGLEKKDKNLNAYQLSSLVLNKLNITNGVLTKFHEKSIGTESYKAELQMLEHDMLYGEKEVYNGINPYSPTDMKMGVEDITIKSASIIEDSIFVIGNNFTKWSNIFVNGKKQSTKFINDILLITDSIEANPGDIITVTQIADDGTVLGTTKEYEFK
jgi:phosphoglycerol transferase MdoB-like AlkP superfamily enzyme